MFVRRWKPTKQLIASARSRGWRAEPPNWAIDLSWQHPTGANTPVRAAAWRQQQAPSSHNSKCSTSGGQVKSPWGGGTYCTRPAQTHTAPAEHFRLPQTVPWEQPAVPKEVDD